MITNTIRSIQDIKQRCCSHCNKVHANTSHRNTRKNRVPHHRSDRQSPTNLNSPIYHCQDVHNTASTTSGPSDATKINTCLQYDTASNTFHQQVSHLTTHNMASSVETHLITDSVIDGQTAFHTTLQIVTSQGGKPPLCKSGSRCRLQYNSPVPLPFSISKHFTKSGALKKSALKPMYATWSAHDGECRHFLGYIVLNVQHKTTPQILPIKFYVFEDFTNPTIILSFAASSRLGIVQFTVPNKTPVNFPS